MFKKVAITGGGSAGHVVPALAVAAELHRRGECDIVYFGRRNSIEEDLAVRSDIRFLAIPSAGLRRFVTPKNIAMPLFLVAGIVKAWWVLRRVRPDVVFAKGSFVAVPVGVGAWLARIPLVIHESDHTFGLANRILIPFSDVVMSSTEIASGWWARRNIEVVGLPLRDDLGEGNASRFLEKHVLSGGKPVLLVFCGSQGSVRVNLAIRTVLADLLDQFEIVHVVGKGNLDDSLVGVSGYRQFEYLHDDMIDALWAADVIVCRAGATTLAEVSNLNKRAVIVPLPTSASRGDQLENARVFARETGNQVVLDDEHLAENLLKACNELAQCDLESNVKETDPELVRKSARLIADRILSLGTRSR